MSEDQAPYSTPHITAGPELDALIAEKVMGLAPSAWPWRCLAEHHHLDDNSGSCPGMSAEDVFCYDCARIVRHGERVPPHYSTDIAAAWTVFDHLADTVGYCGMAIHKCSLRDGGKYTVTENYEDPDCLAEESTAPFAICVAALKLVEKAK